MKSMNLEGKPKLFVPFKKLEGFVYCVIEEN